MDSKDARIAHLEGMVEAYQNQTKALSLELLRIQVAKLHEEVEGLKRIARGREHKAGVEFVELSERVDRMAEFLTELKRMEKRVDSC